MLRRKAELQLYIKRLAADLSRDGIEITPAEIASLDIIQPPEEIVHAEPASVSDIVSNAMIAQSDKLEDSLEKFKAEIKNERAQPISTEKVIRIQQPITKPKAVNFKRDESGRICGATLEEVEA